nr:hypothetical protein Clen_62 [Cedratvirus lena]
MLQVYSTILSLHDEPKEMFGVCSLFMSVLSSKSFWKERHEREGLPFVDHNISPLRAYYLTKEFVSREVILEGHLSELPFFPSFAQGEEYYPRAIKFRREGVPQSINKFVKDFIFCYGMHGKVIHCYRSKKAQVDDRIGLYEKALQIKDPENPSLDVYASLYKVETDKYCFYLYLDLEGTWVLVEKTIVDIERALSFYLQVKTSR